jgi:signal transduction histidine kinase
MGKKVMSIAMPDSPAGTLDAKDRLSVVFGPDFLHTFVDVAAEKLSAQMVSIGTYRPVESGRIILTAVQCEERDLTGLDYDARVAPCNEVIHAARAVVVPAGVQAAYPEDAFFREMNYQSYVGLPVRTAGGDVIGVAAACWDREVDPSEVQAFFELFAHYEGRMVHTLESQRSFDTLKALAIASSDLSSEEVFRLLAKNLQQALSVKVAFIAECSDDTPEQFRLLAYCLGDDVIKSLEGQAVRYEDTPCRLLKERDKAMVTFDLWREYPQQPSFEELGLQSYLGIAIHDQSGRQIGHVALQNDRAMNSSFAETELVNLLTDRVQVELQRYRSEKLRRETEAALFVKKKNESLGLLAGSISHDFNNLLAGMIGNLELAMRELEPGSEAQEYLDVIGNGLDASSELVAQLLNFAKGAPSSAMQSLDLVEVVQEVLKLLPLDKSQRQLVTDLPQTPMPVFADRSQLTQLLLNLMFNAVEAVQGGNGQIVVRVKARSDLNLNPDEFIVHSGPFEPESIELIVADTGVGMNRETASRVFDPYFTTKEDGKGLGMSAVVGIARRHNASIAMDSTEGQGTTFRVVFPRSAYTTQSGEDERISPTVKAQKGMRVLVIDDDAVLRRTVELLLRTESFDVVSTDGYQEACRALKDNGPFDLALVDITMPEMNGWEVRARLEKQHPDLRFIMMSGYSISPNEAGYPEFAGALMLDKPFKLSDVLTAMKTLDDH